MGPLGLVWVKAEPAQSRTCEARLRSYGYLWDFQFFVVVQEDGFSSQPKEKALYSPGYQLDIRKARSFQSGISTLKSFINSLLLLGKRLNFSYWPPAFLGPVIIPATSSPCSVGSAPQAPFVNSLQLQGRLTILFQSDSILLVLFYLIRPAQKLKFRDIQGHETTLYDTFVKTHRMYKIKSDLTNWGPWSNTTMHQTSVLKLYSAF